MRISSIPTCFFISILILESHSFAQKKEAYIVCMKDTFNKQKEGSGLLDPQKLFTAHLEFLGNMFPGFKEVRDHMLYSYSNIMDGFSVMLDQAQAERLQNDPGVYTVLKNTERKMDTTFSWDFLGLEQKMTVSYTVGRPSLFTNVDQSLLEKANYGDGIVIGSIDSGVWPESPSFNDEGLGPPPRNWRGICQREGNFTCNRKIIGARYFHKGYEVEVGQLDPSVLTVRDHVGHGTHTAATAAGSPVPGVNVFGHGNGTARGGAPKARIAAYKVCWPPVKGNGEGGCFDADILAAFDAAISDGVDVISMSLGGSGLEMYMDAAAFGAYKAVQSNVVVVMSAGNDGPAPGTVKNVPPWVITVGASTTDRMFASYVTLGNNRTFKGTSLSEKELPLGRYYPLIKGSAAKVQNATVKDAAQCRAGTLDMEKVTGKIVVCLRGGMARAEKGQNAALAGAVGMILSNDKISGIQTLAEPHVLPASHVSFAAGVSIAKYIQSTQNPTAMIGPVKTEFGSERAPMVASFSATGPNPFEPEILKPDLIAPGVSIISGFTQSIGPSELEVDRRKVLYNAMSGTSMSAPHIAGICALLKVIHPNWTPPSFKSALMTSATIVDNQNMPILGSNGQPATPFAYGAGLVQPSLAADPGLLYVMPPSYHTVFGNFRGTYPMIGKAISNGTAKPTKWDGLARFNYPSISVPFMSGKTTTYRYVKNVGPASTYRVTVTPPPGVSVTVEPDTITFHAYGETRNFKITFEPQVAGQPKEYVFGRMVWSNGMHNVSSSLVVKHV